MMMITKENIIAMRMIAILTCIICLLSCGPKKAPEKLKLAEAASFDIAIRKKGMENGVFMINDSLVGDAIHVAGDSLKLSQYAQESDRLMKVIGNDTLYDVRGHRVEKFLAIKG